MFGVKKGTLCAWCGKPIKEGFLYQTEIICEKCYSQRKESIMENWQFELDRQLTTPPDDDEEITIKCECGNTLYEGDEYYEIDGRIWCPECIDDFLSDHKKTVGE